MIITIDRSLLMIGSNIILLLCVFALTVSSWSIRPLRAGTIEIRDKDIRAEKTFARRIDLKLAKAEY
jgi:hypothetical protein